MLMHCVRVDSLTHSVICFQHTAVCFVCMARAAGFADTVATLMRTIDIAKTQMQALEAAHGPHINRPHTAMVAVPAEEA